MSVLTEGMGGGGDDPGDNRDNLTRRVIEHATATARAQLTREQELRAQLLDQKRERELRAQLLDQKRERELRAQLLGQKREQELRAQLLEQKRQREQDELMADEQPNGDGADDLMVVEQHVGGDTSAVPGAVPASGQGQALVPGSWNEVYQDLNPQDHSYQLTSDGQWFWHPADPGTLIGRGTFVTYRRDGTQGFYKNAHLIKKDHDPAYGNGFWLTPTRLGQGRASFDVSQYAAGGPDANHPQGCVYVPWQHIVEHLYGYTAMGDKESHSFFPPGTTEADLLQYLVDALNSGADKVQVDGVDAGIQWTVRGRRIKTFFRWLRDGHRDKYTIDETTFVMDNL